MLSGSMDATTAALEVGYESPSQFSREYRRVFGLPPLKDIKAAQKNYTAADLESFLKRLNNFQKSTRLD
jgi:AraC-like DNA-binding protein